MADKAEFKKVVANLNATKDSKQYASGGYVREYIGDDDEPFTMVSIKLAELDEDDEPIWLSFYWNVPEAVLQAENTVIKAENTAIKAELAKLEAKLAKLDA